MTNSVPIPLQPAPSTAASSCGGHCADFTIAENLCQVLSNAWVNAEYKHLVLKAPPIALAVLPGQFFHLNCPPSGNDVPYLRRPMSLYRVSPQDCTIEFLYKVQGAGTRGLATLEPGATLDAFGPVGQGFTLPPQARHVLVLARGVGLATMAPLAQHAVQRGARVTAILSARSPALVMSEQYLRSVGADVIVVHDQDGSSDIAHIEKLVRERHAQLPFDLLTTCGSNRFLLALQRLGQELDVPAQVALEQLMGCALGMCFACVRPFRKSPGSETMSYRRVCWDGPVFDAQETVTW
ncbi:dihydroorotate dehydrogenase electron transfer subunit [Herbaspirillum sp. AP02]|jgi:dihydroorotate dehydrogenase electron transfer subunit|uniref:Dihydroorotate dehydrogenase electron transfer subunit n=1 Tax=Herbaspirillum frisingense TaxID=92645 RepID=A0ABU1PGC2_9BURK|nr:MULTISPECIES: dihydroorotate dehydrogenase electron transfer subunit [Herbaspirillum]MBG7619077.1 dihydroorotate dehydrogenase electron transfer subunit [Herbaspirillum sp. AP02]MDR6584899.1 dihydroorotate dehydrogenase electron transfer subunit [Herbaspirillum frisingense]NZD66361.1 dihydroorotate dehydrogenase electron transfer subunit [Herbaspirillum sp. AP21]PLY60755.1 dihydroorotate dehydrogenase electron transfer subunit [Herbaspirillum sp. BH-1]